MQGFHLPLLSYHIVFIQETLYKSFIISIKFNQMQELDVINMIYEAMKCSCTLHEAPGDRQSFANCVGHVKTKPALAFMWCILHEMIQRLAGSDGPFQAARPHNRQLRRQRDSSQIPALTPTGCAFNDGDRCRGCSISWAVQAALVTSEMGLHGERLSC